MLMAGNERIGREKSNRCAGIGIASGRAGSVFSKGLRFFLSNSEATGKAVKSGHSCAAVTHHRPPFRHRCGSKANLRIAGGEGEGREHAKRANSKGPNRQNPKQSPGQCRRVLGLAPGFWNLRGARKKCGVRTSAFRDSPCRCLVRAPATNLQRTFEGWE